MDAEFWEKVKPRFVQPQEKEITPTQQQYQILIHCLVNRSINILDNYCRLAERQRHLTRETN